MNLRNAYLILMAFCFAILIALFMYVALLNNINRQHRSVDKNQVSDESRQQMLLDIIQHRKHMTPNQLQVGLEQRDSSNMRSEQDECLINKFPFRRDFSFPQPLIMKSMQQIASSQWVCRLRQYLSDFTSDKPVALVTSNSKYTDVLLNWLISATVRSNIPLKTIMVISMEEKLHKMLVSRGIPSVFVSPSMVFLREATFSEMFEQVMMLRLTVMRVINHFGFDVVMYDTDAVILKDPQPLYDELPNDDIIGSVGKIPEELVAEWGITICIGVVLVKSSVQTGV